MGKEKRGPLALELWAKQLINSYPGVCVRNMTTSWRNGLAFAALIHVHRPDLIDYDKLDPLDIVGNCSLAFDVAESKLGIPSLLDPLDMENMECPDRLSVLTYVAQFYSAFKNVEPKSRLTRGRDENDALAGSPRPDKKIVTKRKNEVSEDEIMDQVRRSMPKRAVLFNPSNVCVECKNPVFISERVLFMKKLYHRSCFCCSKCKNPLNPNIVDVSTNVSLSDLSIFCLEKTCHVDVELLRTTVNESCMNFVPDGNNECEKTQNANPSDSCADTQKPSKSNLPTEAITLVSSMKSEFDNVVEDSRSKGDIEIEKLPDNELPECSPRASPIPHTPRNTRKLLDFAGSLLHKDELQSESPIKSSPVDGDPVQVEKIEEVLENNGESALIKEVDGVDEQETEVYVKPSTNNIENENSNPNDESRSDLLLVKSTAEVISIRENAILTIADQFRANVEETEADNQYKNEKEEQSIDQVESLSSLQSDIITVEENSNKVIDACPHFDDDNEQKSRNSVGYPSEATVNQNPPLTDELMKPCEWQENNPFEEDEESKCETLKPDETVVSQPASPCPVPKMRPPKPPPPKFPTSPKSPTPRSRTNQTVTTPGEDGSQPADELWRKKDYYPNELNPFASEEDLPQAVQEESKNPFEDDEKEEQPPPTPSPRPKPRSEINNNSKSKASKGSPTLSRKNAANFNVPPPRPPPPSLSRQQPSSAKPYNPFDDEDDDIGAYEDDKPTGGGTFSPKPPDDTSSISSKTSDLSSISGVPTPTPRSLNASDTEGTGSLKARSRKSRRAPLPPNMMLEQQSSPIGISPISGSQKLSSESHETPQRKVIPASPKLMKGLDISNNSHKTGFTTPRKKRRAPPPRRRVEPLPEAAIKTEIADLEIKLKELERQGIALETKIRSLPEEVDSSTSPSENQEGSELEVNDDSEDIENANSANDQADDLMIQLWSIVNEKNVILRRQTELDYLRRGHRLEEMQSELEFKIRMLYDTPDDQKQPNQADMENVLLEQLLKLVDERNEVVEWLDYHRQKDLEEELMHEKSITEFSNATVEPIPDQPASSSKSKSKDKKHKDKSKDDKEKKDGKLRLGIFKKKSKKPKPVEGSTN